MIYFVQADVLGLIKIGTCTESQVEQRLWKLQTDCPTSVTPLLLVEGGVLAEQELHRRFDEFRFRRPGEWFFPARAVVCCVLDKEREHREPLGCEPWKGFEFRKPWSPFADGLVDGGDRHCRAVLWSLWEQAHCNSPDLFGTYEMKLSRAYLDEHWLLLQ